MDDDAIGGVETVDQFFWSLEVKPGKQYIQELEFNLHIRHVSLEGDVKPNSKTVLYCQSGDGVKHPIVTLRGEKMEQMSLSLFFPFDETLRLSSEGPGTVHLLGFCEQIDDQSSDDESDEEGEEFEEESEEESEEEEVEPEPVPVKGAKRKAKAEPSQAPPSAKRTKENSTAANTAVATKPATKRPTSASTPNLAPGKQEKATPKKAAPEKKAATPAPKKKEETPAKKETKKEEDGLGVTKKLSMGVQSTVQQVGKGVAARPGKKVSVQYKGVLHKGGKQFDSGKFSFRLGTGEVIQGWDIGVAGMKIGEKRVLVIPPNAGYGRKGAPPDIPPNATLRFDVTLLNVQ